MALVKPIGISTPAFDATQNHLFQFQALGGNQIVKNRLIIRNNNTTQIVYNQETTTYKYEHLLPANTLQNGVYYNFSFITYDKDSNASMESSPISFYCFTQPTLKFTNIPSNNIIETSTFNFEFTYDQKEKELLDYVVVNLFDANGNLLIKSNEIYGTDIVPTLLSYTVSGLLDNISYDIQLIGKTVNNTEIRGEKTHFTVNYYYPELFNVVDVTNLCEQGSVHVTNNVVLIEGDNEPNPPKYLDGTKVNLNKKDDYIRWNKGFKIGDTFTLQAWLNPVLKGETIRLYNESDPTKRIEIALEREIPFGESEYKDSIVVRYYDEKKVNVYKYSDYHTLVNNLSDLIVWVRKTKDDILVKLVEKNHVDNVLQLNAKSNIEINKITNYPIHRATIEPKGYLIWNKITDVLYNRPTNMIWGKAPTAWSKSEAEKNLIRTAPKREGYFGDYNLGTIDTVLLRNGVYDHFSIVKDVTQPYSDEKTTWTYDTIINCDFNENIVAGNTDLILNQISSIKIKRRKIGAFEWITLKEIPINTYEDLSFSYDDYYVPTNEEFEYAIVPVLKGNIEGAYVSNRVKTEFKDLFLTDGEQTFKLFAGVAYPSHSSEKLIGMSQPYGSKYPVIVSNSIVDYQTISISGKIMGDKFEVDKTIDSKSIIDKQEAFDKFLKNGKPKIFKDWNGRIFLGVLTSPVGYSYGSGMVIPTVTFTLTEQGQWDKQSDLFKNGLIEVVS